MSQIEVRLLAAPGTLPPVAERIQTMATLVPKLMATAVEQGDVAVALNCLLGAYLSLAIQPPEGSGINTTKALNALASAANTVRRDLGQEQAPQTHEQAVIQLANRINEFVSGAEHEVVLGALITLFIEGAIKNPCCTEGCAKAATEASHRLTLAASTAQTAGTHVH